MNREHDCDDKVFDYFRSLIVTFGPAWFGLFTAIRNGKSIQIEQSYRFWAPVFKALRKVKYADLCVQHLVDLHFIWDQNMIQVLRSNRTVSLLGRPEKSKDG